ncbi:hypothetical protein [Xylophilus ampelinus]|nr:hypothetical protein [Xylophilus ampelinus]MCS4511561.1 hypothetical protein [Xylophilus ampelinus]
MRRTAYRVLAAALLCAGLVGCKALGGAGTAGASGSGTGTGGSGLTVFGTVDAAVTRSR